MRERGLRVMKGLHLAGRAYLRNTVSGYNLMSVNQGKESKTGNPDNQVLWGQIHAGEQAYCQAWEGDNWSGLKSTKSSLIRGTNDYEVLLKEGQAKRWS